MGDGTEVTESCSAHTDGPRSTCHMCQELTRRRSAGSGSTARTREQLEIELKGHITAISDELLLLRRLIYCLVKDRGGAAVFSTFDLLDADKNWSNLKVLQQQDPWQLITKIKEETDGRPIH